MQAPNGDAQAEYEPMEQQQQEDDDDDDDIDFNLGGGSSSMMNAVQPEDTGSPPPFGTVHKASAKEDG